MDHPLTNSFMLSSNPFFDVSVRNTSLRRARHSNQAGSDFRSVVYRSNLWATPLPDITGRFRECSAHFYRFVCFIFIVNCKQDPDLNILLFLVYYDRFANLQKCAIM